MRPEELVRRADQHVAAPGGNVDRPVRAVVDGVDPGERARLVRQLDHAAHVGRGADGVGGRRERDHPCPVGALRGEVVEVEREVVVHVDEPDDDPDVLGERQPGSDVRVVVEARHEHLVAGLELAGERAREQEVEGRHALAERHLAGIAAQEGRRALVRRVDELVRVARRRVRRPDVGVVLAQVPADRVDHLVGALRAARPVEEGERTVERGVARAHRPDVEQRRAHATLHV